MRYRIVMLCGLLLTTVNCKKGQPVGKSNANPAPWISGYRVYVTNESTGNLSVIGTGQHSR
jgi:hypothetical protein